MEEKSIMAITLIRVCQDPVFTQGIWEDPLRGRQQQGVVDSPKVQCLLWETPWDRPVGNAAQQSGFTHLRLNIQISCPASARKVSAPAAETGPLPCAVGKHMKDMKPWGASCLPPPHLSPLPSWQLAEATQISPHSKMYIKGQKNSAESNFYYFLMASCFPPLCICRTLCKQFLYDVT